MIWWYRFLLALLCQYVLLQLGSIWPFGPLDPSRCWARNRLKAFGQNKVWIKKCDLHDMGHTETRSIGRPFKCLDFFVIMIFCYDDFIIKTLVSYYDVLCCHDEPIVMFSVPSFPHSNNSQDTTLIVGCTKRNIFIIFNPDNLTNQNYFFEKKAKKMQLSSCQATVFFAWNRNAVQVTFLLQFNLFFVNFQSFPIKL